jgi:hypothetical protein
VDDALYDRLAERTGIYQDARGYWRASRPLDADAVLTALGLLGGNQGPGLLSDLDTERAITADVRREVLVEVWTSADFPERLLPRSTWVAWFREAAYAKPAGVLTIYRGATPRFARGMAWTTDIGRARWFANRWGRDLEIDSAVMLFGTAEQREAEQRRFELALVESAIRGIRRAFVYEARIEPEGVLAMVDDVEPDIRREGEVIVDPAWLPALFAAQR